MYLLHRAIAPFPFLESQYQSDIPQTNLWHNQNYLPKSFVLGQMSLQATRPRARKGETELISPELALELRCLRDNYSLSPCLDHRGWKGTDSILLCKLAIEVQPDLKVERVAPKLCQILAHLNRISSKDSFDLILPAQP